MMLANYVMPNLEVGLIVNVLWLLLGISIGLLFSGWQRSRWEARNRELLRHFRSPGNDSSLASSSQLAIAIAQQQKIIDHLEQQLEIYRQVLHGAPVGYLQVDDENRLLWCNQQAQEFLGLSQDQYPKPRLLLELVRSYELDHLIEQTRNAGKPCQQDWTFYPVSADPSHLSQKQALAVRGYGFPLSNEQVGIFLENRQEAITLMQQRDRWASDVAHELKTPLTSIRLVAETLQVRLEPPLRTWVDRLINEIVRLSSLVQDLLDLSQIDRGSFQSLPLKVVDLVELTQSAWLNLEPLARKKWLQLDYHGPDHLLLQVDEQRIYRVLINLLDNSIKFSPPRQHIKLQITLENHPSPEAAITYPHICLEVIDAGCGFSEEALPHVFERFYRADPSRARMGTNQELSAFTRSNNTVSDEARYPHSQTSEHTHHQTGSGLGLSIVKQIVEAHHGLVSASNYPETGGAWLRVYLPYLPPLDISAENVIKS